MEKQDTKEIIYTVDDIIRQLYSLGNRSRNKLYLVSGDTTIQSLFNM